MNKCHFLKDIGSYLDNQLSENKKIKLEGHLGKCSLCAQELNQLKTLSEKLRQWYLPSLDPSFDSSVKNKIVAWELQGGKVKMKKKTLAILVPSGALAGILVIAFLGATYLKQGIGGRLSSAPDSVGAKFQYEPYYLERPSAKPSADNRLARAAYPGRTGTLNIEEGGRFLEGFQNRVKEQNYLTSGRQQNLGLEAYENNGVVLGSGAFSSLDMSNSGTATIYASASPKYARVLGSADQSTAPYAPGGYPPQVAGQDSVIVIQPLLPATGTGEMIIRNAELRLEVENGKETYKKISEICQELGGYLAESNFFRDDQGRESGRITLRIPKDKFLTALDKLDGLGKVKDSNTTSQDVSQDYANLKSQLDAAKIVYDKMLEALKKRQNTIPEAIKLESELTPVLRRIEVLKNQIERLNNLTSFTTITVNFYESEVSAKVLEDTRQLIKKEMLAAKIRAVRWFAKNILFVGSGIGLFVVAVAAIAMLAAWIKQLIKRN